MEDIDGADRIARWIRDPITERTLHQYREAKHQMFKALCNSCMVSSDPDVRARYVLYDALGKFEESLGGGKTHE